MVVVFPVSTGVTTVMIVLTGATKLDALLVSEHHNAQPALSLPQICLEYFPTAYIIRVDI